MVKITFDHTLQKVITSLKYVENNKIDRLMSKRF